MKRGLSIEWETDFYKKPVLTIRKKRGQLTLDEIREILQYEASGAYNGRYAILLNCSEQTVGGNGLYLEEDQKGDMVDLYQLEDEDDCPVCGHTLPPFSYCPHCGTSWKDDADNAEKHLAAMRKETEHEIGKSSLTPEARAAWYWTYIGSVDLARHMGFITDERRQEIYHQVEHLRPNRVSAQDKDLES